MKYFVLILDGAAGLPLKERDGRTCLELAVKPNMDSLAREGTLGMARTVPEGIEPSSACACMSVMGYDPAVYYRGRATIEAKSMGITIGPGEVVFRCNLVTVRNGVMEDYSAGHIESSDARELIAFLDRELGNENIKFYPGVSYRHILKLKGYSDTLKAKCTPPHDIIGKKVAEYLPRGEGSAVLRQIMSRSQVILRGHEVNLSRQQRGKLPATTIWLFWGSGQVPDMPPFDEVRGLRAALTSGVDLLRGLAAMAGMTVLKIGGVTDGPDSDHAAQVVGALRALENHDLVIVHIEAPDEAGHAGDIDGKVKIIERIDAEVVSRLRERKGDGFRVLVMPDHPTPIATRTHAADPVPFLIWGGGVGHNGASRFTEAEAQKTGLFLAEGYKIMEKFVGDRI